MKWISFMDMHSGGGAKIEIDGTDITRIYIEARDEGEGIRVFEKHFGRDPYHTTCRCCGPDYSVSEHDTLEQATGYERHCAYENGAYVERPTKYYDAVITLEDYMQRPGVVFIYADGLMA